MALDIKKLIKHLRKRHKPSEEFSSAGLKSLVVATEGKTSKGAGIMEHIWELAEGDCVWISDDRICVFIKPDAKLVSCKLDRYANEIAGDKEPEVVKLNKRSLGDRIQDAKAAARKAKEKKVRRS